jgi:quinol monooxygenase YgiN
MALMGGSAAGALLWGQVAAFAGVNGAVLAASAFAVLVAAALRRTSIVGEVAPDFSPAPAVAAPEPAMPVDDDAGPVMVTVEYRIDPARTAEFAAVMERTRRARLRQGALSWGLFHDVAQPGRCIEVFVDENWLEHQRRLERFTAFDADLRGQRLAFHLGPEPPKLSRFVADGRVAPPDL